MAEQNISPRDFFATESAIADLGLIAWPRRRGTVQAGRWSPGALGARGWHGC